VVTADGHLVYNELASGEKAGFEEFRRDPALKPFLTDFVDVDSIDPLPATRAIKKLIWIISEKQDFVELVLVLALNVIASSSQKVASGT